VVIFGLIAWEKMPRMCLAILGAVIVMVLGVLDVTEAANAVSWETIGFLLGMFLLIEILVEAGFFRWIALSVARGLHYSPLRILVFFPLLAFIMSAFINSITVMVFLSVVTYELGRLLKFDAVTVIVSEVVLANIGGAGTLIGDPPNVILGTQLGFGFNAFILHNGPIALAAAVAAVGVNYWTHRRRFADAAIGVDLTSVKSIDLRAQLGDRYLLVCGLAGMVVALALLIGRPLWNHLHIPINIATASLFPAFAILTFGGKRIHRHQFMRRIDAETLLFFIGLFIIVAALEKRFIIQMAANSITALFTTPLGFVSSTYWGAAIVSALVDNVPLAMGMAPVIKQSVAHSIVPTAGIMVWATSMAVDLGGNLTPIGASANVVAYSFLEKSGVRLGWKRWFRLALPPGLIALAVGYVGIVLKLKFGFY
jgi:Na+/H+ antiporter NhaD/arsenite permease-like protein